MADTAPLRGACGQAVTWNVEYIVWTPRRPGPRWRSPPRSAVRRQRVCPRVRVARSHSRLIIEVDPRLWPDPANGLCEVASGLFRMGDLDRLLLVRTLLWEPLGGGVGHSWVSNWIQDEGPDTRSPKVEVTHVDPKGRRRSRSVGAAMGDIECGPPLLGPIILRPLRRPLRRPLFRRHLRDPNRNAHRPLPDSGNR